MASTVAELLVKIGADISGLKKGMSDADAGVKGLERSVDATASKLGKGFDTAALQVTGSLGRIPVVGNAAFNEIVTAAQAAFSRVDVASQASSQSIKSIADAANGIVPALNNVAASAQTVGSSVSGQASVAAASLKGIGTNATVAGQAINSASAQARAALTVMGGSASAAGNSVAALTARIAENKALIAGYDTDIATARGELSLLNQRIVDATSKFGSNSNQVKDLRTQYAQLSAATRGLVAEKGILVDETRKTKSSLEGMSSGAAAAGEGIFRLTSMMNTGQGPLRGYDALIQGVLRSFGGIPLIWAIAIPIAINLADVILSLGKAKKEQIKLDDDMIVANAALLSGLRQTTDGFTKQAAAQRLLVEADLTAILAGYVTAQSNVAKGTAELTSAQTKLFNVITSGEQSVRFHREGLEGLSREYDNTERAIARNRDAVAAADAELHKSQAILREQVNTLLTYQGATQQADAAIEAMARRLKFTDEQLNQLRESLNNTTIAQQALNVEMAKLPTVQFDTSATGTGIAAQVKAAADAMAAAKGVFGDFKDAVSAASPNLAALNKNLKEFAQTHGKNAADTLRVYRAELAKLPPDLQAAIALLDQAGKNAEAFSTKVKKAKDELDKNSPFITERVLAGNPADIDGMVARFGKRVGDAFDRDAGGFKDLASKFIKSMVAGFDDAKELDQAVGASTERLADAIGKKLSTNLAMAADQIKLAGVDIQAATDEMMRRSFVDRIREQLGITEELWRKFSAETKAQVDRVISRVAQDYMDSVEQMRFVAEKELERQRTVWKRFADGVADDDVQKIRVAMFELTFSIAGAAKAIENSNLLKLEVDMKKLSEGAIDAADAIKGTVESITGDLESMLPPVERVQAGVRDGVKQFVDDLIRMGESLGLIGADLERFVQEHLSRLPEHLKKTGEEMVEVWKNELIKLPGALDDIFNKIFAKWKGATSGILDIVGALPGKIGDKLRAGTNVVLDWIDRIDTILKGLHKIFNQIPDGLADIFKKAQKTVQTSTGAVKGSMDDLLIVCRDSWGDIGSTTTTAAAKVEAGSSRMVTALAAVGAAATMLGQIIGGRAGSAISGAGAGMGLGAAIGSLFGPGPGTAIGAVIGGIGGAIAGLFGFGGKSAAQKEQERLQQEQLRLAVEKAKQDVAKGAQEVVQAALSTFIKAREALEAISAHFRIPKEVFNLFFKDLGRLLDEFIKLSKKFGGDLLKKASQFAEFLSPGVDLISKAPLALEAIGKYLGVTEAAIIRFFADFSRIVDHLGVLAESVPGKLQRHVKKFAARIGDAVGLVADVANGLKAMFEVKPLDAGAFDNFGFALEAIINKIGDIAERFDKYYIKQIGLFSERVAPGIALFAGTVQAIKDAVEVPRLNPQALEGIFTDLTAIVHRAIDFTRAIPTDVLALVAETAQRVVPIIQVVQSMAEAFKAVMEYKSVKGAFQDLLADFIEAVAMMRHLEDLSFQMETRAMSIEGALTRAATAMTNGIAKFGSALGLSHGVLTAGLSSFTHVANPEGAGFAGLSLAPGISPGFPSGPSIVNNDNRTVVSIEGIDLNDEQSANLRRVLEQIFGPLERLAVST